MQQKQQQYRDTTMENPQETYIFVLLWLSVACAWNDLRIKRNFIMTPINTRRGHYYCNSYITTKSTPNSAVRSRGLTSKVSHIEVQAVCDTSIGRTIYGLYYSSTDYDRLAFYQYQPNGLMPQLMASSASLELLVLSSNLTSTMKPLIKRTVNYLISRTWKIPSLGPRKNYWNRE